MMHRPNKVAVTRTFATRGGGALYYRLADFLHCVICVATYFVINRSMLNETNKILMQDNH